MRSDTYDGALLASGTQTNDLSCVDTDNTSYLFDMGGAAITTGSLVTFALTQETGPTEQVFYAVTVDPGTCDIIQTNGTSSPLDSFRRDGVVIRIRGMP